ncbi:MAG: GFA family protein [Parvibaculaceae bacterium]
MTLRTARCSCGKLEVRCAGEPVSVSLCHCLECQKRTGSTYGIAAFYPRSAVEPSGPATSYTRASDSGHPVTFHFCPACGSTVYWEPSRKPDFIAVAVGAFADPSFPAPSKGVYGDHRHPWVGELG